MWVRKQKRQLTYEFVLSPKKKEPKQDQVPHAGRKKSRENIGIINYKICTLNFICTCRIHHMMEMFRKDPH